MDDSTADGGSAPRGAPWAIVTVAALAVAGQGLAAFYLVGDDGEAAPTPAPTAPPGPAPDAPSPAPPATASATPSAPAQPPAAQPTAPAPTPAPVDPALPPRQRADALTRRAQKLLQRGGDGRVSSGQDLEPARAELKQALELSPEQGLALRLAAEVEQAAGDPGGALPLARRAVKAAPDDPWAFLIKAEALLDLEQAEQAAPELETALALAELRPADTEGRQLRAWGLTLSARLKVQQGSYADALKLLQQARLQSPVPLAQVELLAGVSLHRLASAQQASYQQARPCYDRAIRLNPRLADAWYYRGALWFDMAVYGQAVADLERAEALAEDGAQHHFELSHLRLIRGLAREKLQRWEEAWDDLTAYLGEAEVGEDAVQVVQPVLRRLAARLGKPDPFQGGR